jgi:uncharacterized membrane protein
MLRYELMFLAGGLLVTGLGIPLAQRRIGPNRWYGLRVPATAANEDVWYEANAATGHDFVVLGILQFVLAALPIIATIPEPIYVGVNLVAIVLGALVVTTTGVARANRLLREQTGGTPFERRRS